MGRQQVLARLRAQRPLLHERFGVARLALFGSVARNEGRPDSDVDLLVEFDRPVGMFRFLELQSHLEVLLGCNVDLGTPRSLKRGMRDRVLSEAVEIGYLVGHSLAKLGCTPLCGDRLVRPCHH